jgi:hypothetical protein
MRSNGCGWQRRLVIENLESRVLLSVTQPGTLNRPADPVVLTGADVPALAGIVPGDLVAFRDTGSGWQQIPVQVDERAMVTMYQIYGQSISHVNQTILTYTDPNTFVGPDPNSTLDADDEIVFMAKDTGGRVPGSQAAPADVDALSRLEILVSDPVDAGNKGWIYLFSRSSNALDPGAGVSYVDYQFNLLVGNGDYQTNYDTLSGPNPENSTIETAYYGRRFIERWTTDDLRIKAGTGVDLLDRHKFQFAPGYSGRTENTFSAAEGAFVINKSGPVRALRSWVGANSGPYTQREEVYYEQREDVITYLRVHAIPAGMDLFDYNAAANGMTYHNNLNLAGVVVDGEPDTVAVGLIEWELITGAQGSLSQSHVINTNLPGYSLTSYYLDDTTPSPPNNQVSGDSQAWGQSGPWLQNLESTDTGSPYFMTSRRAMYYSGPGASVADAERNDSLVRDPLQAAVDESPPTSSTVAGRHIFYNQSAWDGNSAAIDAVNDNLAIATDKTAYLPGAGVAVYGNITSFSRGINGIIVDLSAAMTHTGISAADFVFKVGNDNAPSGWAAAPAPSAISVIAGGGVGGADRVEITWATGIIKNQWLEVQVLATANTGLASTDVHFWGNKIGDSGTSTPAGTFDTTSTDAAQVFATIGAGKPITDLRDYNRDGAVTSTDAAIVFANIGGIARINIAGGGPFAPEAEPMSTLGGGAATNESVHVPRRRSESALASALAKFERFRDDTSPAHTISELANARSESGRVAALNEHREHTSMADRARALENYHEQSHDLNLGDELLDSLLDVVGTPAATNLHDLFRR